jgi:hypothetical protein
MLLGKISTELIENGFLQMGQSIIISSPAKDID